MTWLTWRHQRLESLIGGIAIGLLAVVLLWTGHTMIATYENGGSAACVASHASSDRCGTITTAFAQQFDRLNALANSLNLLPLFIGLLLAAPFILEFEHGTHRLAWTQSISRRRWLTTKLGWMMATAITVSLGLSLLWSWWHEPYDQLQGRFDESSFNFEGIVPIAYTVFALALCLAVGTLLRRTAPAIALAFAGFVGLRLVIQMLLRPHFMAPLKLVWDATGPTPAAAPTRLGNGDWVLGKGFALNGGSTPASPEQVMQACSSPPTGPGKIQSLGNCLHAHGILNSIVYQPANRFWIFQGIESAIFLGIAAALLAVTVWWVLHRIA